MTGTSVEAVLAELASLEDPRIREVNERHGDAHAVNLGKLRALAKELRTQHEPSGERRTRSESPHVEDLRVAWLADPDPLVVEKEMRDARNVSSGR